MNRLFGSSSKAPPPTLDARKADLEKQISDLEVQLKDVQIKLRAEAQEIKNAPTNYQRNMHRKEAAKLIEKRGKLTKIKESFESQVDTMWSIKTTQDTIKNSLEMHNSMKVAQKQLKKQYAKVDLDEIERVQDDLADMLDLGNEIQETLSRGFGNPEEIDESELDAELDALGEDVEYELQMQRNTAVPGFLEEEVPNFIDEPPEVDKAKVQEVAR